MSKRPPLGTGTWTLKNATLPDRVQWAIDSGFEAISFSTMAYYTDDQEVKEAAQLARNAGMKTSSHLSLDSRNVPYGELDEVHLGKLLDHTLWLSDEIGGLASCCYDCFRVKQKNGEMHGPKIQNRRALEMTLDAFKGTNIAVGMENSHATSGYQSTSDIEEMLSAPGLEDVGILLDVAHAALHVSSRQIEGEKTVADYIKKLPRRILEVHFSDNKGLDDDHLALGLGIIDYEEVVKALIARGDVEQLTLEFKTDFTSEEAMQGQTNSRKLLLNLYNNNS